MTCPTRPAAELIPFQPHDAGKVHAAIARLKAFQESHSLAGLSIREMIEEGRR